MSAKVINCKPISNSGKNNSLRIRFAMCGLISLLQEINKVFNKVNLIDYWNDNNMRKLITNTQQSTINCFFIKI